MRSVLKDQPGFLAIGHTVFKILSYMERLSSVPRASAGSTVLSLAFHCPDCSTGKGVRTAGRSRQASQVAKRGLAATCGLAPIPSFTLCCPSCSEQDTGYSANSDMLVLFGKLKPKDTRSLDI